MHFQKWSGFLVPPCRYKLTKIGVNERMCLVNNQDYLQLHKFTTSENIAKELVGYFFDSHCRHETL